MLGSFADEIIYFNVNTFTKHSISSRVNNVYNLESWLMKVHITEDNLKLLWQRSKSVALCRFMCDAFSSFEHAIEKIMLYSYDAFLVDVNLSDGSGLDLIAGIRENHLQSGIIIVSARDAGHQKIEERRSKAWRSFSISIAHTITAPRPLGSLGKRSRLK